MILLMFMVVLGEISLYFGNVTSSSYICALTIIAISILSVYNQNKAYFALILIPLIRLITLSQPVLFEYPILNLAVPYALMLLPIFMLIKSNKFSRQELGLTGKGFFRYSLIALALGILLGYFGSIFLKDSFEFFYASNLMKVIRIAVIVLTAILVGAVSEFIFRSALETALIDQWGQIRGIIISSFLFGMVFSIYGGITEIFFGFLAGLSLGYLFFRTRSLPLSALAHCLAIITMVWLHFGFLLVI